MESSMTNECPVCGKRVSDWESASGKTLVVNGKLYHKSCLEGVTIKQVEK